MLSLIVYISFYPAVHCEKSHAFARYLPNPSVYYGILGFSTHQIDSL
jgi:hypothetical protein